MELSILRAMIVGRASGMARATAERIAAGSGHVAIITNPLLDGGTIRIAAGQRIALK
jgi:NAD(P)-dependent dehydrogenase (short-subunit alcohol dehydrogenase family)